MRLFKNGFRGRMLLAIAACALTLSGSAVLASTAAGHGGHAHHSPPFVSATYNDWAYVSVPSTQIGAYRYVNGGGWEPVMLPAGQPVWAHPFSGGWHWAYIRGSWYAIKTEYLARWSCAAPRDAKMSTARSATGYQFNATSSRVVENLGRGQEVEVVCENTFFSANIGRHHAPWGYREFRLVRVTGVTCMALHCPPPPKKYMYVDAMAFAHAV